MTHGEKAIGVKIFNPADLVVLELPDTMEDAYTFKALQVEMTTFSIVTEQIG